MCCSIADVIRPTASCSVRPVHARAGPGQVNPGCTVVQGSEHTGWNPCDYGMEHTGWNPCDSRMDRFTHGQIHAWTGARAGTAAVQANLTVSRWDPVAAGSVRPEGLFRVNPNWTNRPYGPMDQ